MRNQTPETPEQLAEALASAGSEKRTVLLAGRSTKDWMAGPLASADVAISTSRLNRVLKYDPRDLTISVEAGIPYAELDQILAEQGQMLPLDPPYANNGTIGGVLGANLSGPRRRLYGTARDMVIGMKFATIEGKLIQSGGMVVKNVAGLDMAKMMIGSFGTLAAIAVVNFKVVPRPPVTRTFLLEYETLEQSIAKRDEVLKSVLQPSAIDLLNPGAAERVGRSRWCLAIAVAGNAAVIQRYATELDCTEGLEGEPEAAFWSAVREFTPRFLVQNASGAVVRISSTITGIKEAFGSLSVPAIARAGSGTCYAYFGSVAAASGWLDEAAARGWKVVIEFASPEKKLGALLWPCPDGDLEMMRRVKEMFDPGYLLNRGRLYGRL